MTKPIVGIDVDGVLASFNNSYIKLIRDLSGRDLFDGREESPSFPTDWNYDEVAGYNDEEIDKAWDHVKASPIFWKALFPYEGVREFVTELERLGLDVYFITSRPGPTAKKQTEDWLEAVGVDHPTVLISSEKAACCDALEITHYIDDKVENCKDVYLHSWRTSCYMLARPWNTQTKAIPRLDDLATFLAFIQDAMLEP